MSVRTKMFYAGLALVALMGVVTRGCGDAGAPGDRDFLVVVHIDLYEPLGQSLDRYAEAMATVGMQVHVEPWVPPGTATELRSLLFEYVEIHGIEGALLIGDLPAAWYEQFVFDKHEEFPIDLYLQDGDAIWIDADADGVFDGHSDLVLDIYTARLTGSPAQLQAYFERALYYRQGHPLVDVSAFVFIDDDWKDTRTEELFHLGRLYSSVDLAKDRAESTSERYLAKLTGDGAEFVYQWIHSPTPRFLKIDDLDAEGASVMTRVYDHEISTLNLKGSFYNLYDCSAARFTEANLAEQYTVGTDYGLAVIGSTKTGAVMNPDVFHKNLILGRRWGEAYQLWYNQEGKRSDRWHLGIVIMGDPLLRLTGDLFPWGGSTDSSGWTPPGEVEGIEEIMRSIAATSELGTYEDYRQQHPEFFSR